MKNIFKLFLITALLTPNLAWGADITTTKAGYILLQVENNGEAWYLYPDTSSRFFLGRPTDAFAIMKKLALGARHSYIEQTTTFPARLAGQILLDVDNNGEAYYIYPQNLQKYYLGNPTDAFNIMRKLGLGIKNTDLATIPIGDISQPIIKTEVSKFLQAVNFTSQAPFGAWSDIRQEDGCEEASAFMAIKWARGQTFTNDQALAAITGSSDYTLKKYGEYRDISIADTLDWIIKDYFNFKNAAKRTNVTLADILDELKRGNIIIAPMNGQALDNPNFVPPGPTHHMLLIIGYDANRRVFITNDPGTRRGANYEYDFNVLYSAIRDYPTGSHLPTSSIEKNIITVWK